MERQPLPTGQTGKEMEFSSGPHPEKEPTPEGQPARQQYLRGIIRVQQVQGGYAVYLRLNPLVRSGGSTPDEAVGTLCRDHADAVLRAIGAWLSQSDH